MDRGGYGGREAGRQEGREGHFNRLQTDTLISPA